MIVWLFWFGRLVPDHFALAWTFHIPVGIGFLHGFWWHEIPRESGSGTKCVRLIFLSILLRLIIPRRRWSKFWIKSVITANIPNLHKLCIKIILEVIFFVSWKESFNFCCVSTIFSRVEPDYENSLFPFANEVLNLRNLFSICDNNTCVAIVFA